MHAFTSNWVTVASLWPGVQAGIYLRVRVYNMLYNCCGIIIRRFAGDAASLVSRLVTRWIYELNIFHWWWFLSLPAAAMVRLPTLYILVCLYFATCFASLCSYCIVLCWDHIMAICIDQPAALQ